MICDEIILLSAFRYALGRRTYIVSEVVSSIINNWDNLSDKFKKTIKYEIQEAISNLQAGDIDIDVPEWEKILNMKQ